MAGLSTGERARLTSSSGPLKPYSKLGPIVQKGGGTGYRIQDTNHRPRSRQIGLVSKCGFPEFRLATDYHPPATGGAAACSLLPASSRPGPGKGQDSLYRVRLGDYVSGSAAGRGVSSGKAV